MLDYLERLGARLAKGLSQPLNPSAAIIMGVYTFLWGLWIANPFWTVFDQAPIYDWLNSVMPEVYWGLIAIGVGGFMIWGIIRHTLNALMAGAFVGWVHWGAIATGYFLGDWENTGGITSTTIAVYCAFVYLNLQVNRDNFALEK